ncbi:hypothetical protein BS50DRAFT_347221 [Corynespora cassiicola Philippines]|uniref:Uncharacterized protein n=1 Tax=Corynespora cassiicola Philippines TaxID=1448308 RepID=A0A2T2NQZ5_CORCC|nr:hypothetical protein BS50DRAFT_347221 [Corynespora cassiicola Philippines]
MNCAPWGMPGMQPLSRPWKRQPACHRARPGRLPRRLWTSAAVFPPQLVEARRSSTQGPRRVLSRLVQACPPPPPRHQTPQPGDGAHPSSNMALVNCSQWQDGGRKITHLPDKT